MLFMQSISKSESQLTKHHICTCNVQIWSFYGSVQIKTQLLPVTIIDNNIKAKVIHQIEIKEKKIYLPVSKVVI